MLLRSFKEDISQTLKSHNIEDEKLESALTELFSKFERRILSKDFAEEITKRQKRDKRTRDSFK